MPVKPKHDMFPGKAKRLGAKFDTIRYAFYIGTYVFAAEGIPYFAQEMMCQVLEKAPDIVGKAYD